jgi:hypothetical protein
MPDVVAFTALVAAVAAVGLAVGILVAPAVTRWAEREDEEPGDGDR